MKSKRTTEQEMNVSSTADIAFLLLIFFLVSTTLMVDKGLSLKLPPDSEHDAEAPVNSRNLFKVQINSQNQFLVNDEPKNSLEGVRKEIKAFVLNRGKDKKLSISPQKAIVSIKTNRGTDYSSFIMALDYIKGAYFEMYGEALGMTSKEFQALDLKDPEQKNKYMAVRKDIPMNISIAEPNQ